MLNAVLPARRGALAGLLVLAVRLVTSDADAAVDAHSRAVTLLRATPAATADAHSRAVTLLRATPGVGADAHSRVVSLLHTTPPPPDAHSRTVALLRATPLVGVDAHSRCVTLLKGSPNPPAEAHSREWSVEFTTAPLHVTTFYPHGPLLGTNTDWRNPTGALGAPQPNCNTNVSTPYAYNDVESSREWLTVSGWDSLAQKIPATDVIWKVAVDVDGRYDDGTDLNQFVLHFVSGTDSADAYSGAWSQSGFDCAWRMGSPPGTGADITALHRGPWTLADLAALRLGVQRQPGAHDPVPPNRARVAALRLVVSSYDPGASVGVDEPRTPASLRLSAGPNPFAGATTLSFDLPRARWITLEVFDVTGGRVRTLLDGPRAAGTHRVAWDGRDSRGSRAASGVYYLTLDAPGLGRIVKRVALIH